MGRAAHKLQGISRARDALCSRFLRLIDRSEGNRVVAYRRDSKAASDV